ncbi:MAG: hypothetical protein E7333_01540 [Clostridiales bacterium]|nr:hypothetical protein [Clostridiales bacterium]
MGFNFQNKINFLLENACPSIRYLVHRDMLGADMDEPFMVTLQNEILAQSNVKKHLSAQHADGWFGYELHGIDGMDCHISGLLNLGVEARHPAIQKAVTALLTPEIASAHKNWFRGGAALDAEGRGGDRAIVANILAMAKASEDITIYAEQQALAFEHLSTVLQYNSVDDFSIKGKNERYYKPNAKFPGANHIGVLSATQGWRTEDNIATAKAAVKRAYEIMKDVDEYITFKKPSEFGGGFVGPFNYNWQALTPMTEEQIVGIINSSYNFQFAFWLGAVTGVPDWVLQHNGTYEVLADMLERDAIFDKIPEATLRAFKQVLGKAPNYRKKHAIECDVLYAVLRAVWDKV